MNPINSQTPGPLCGSISDATQIDGPDNSTVLLVSEWLGTSLEGCATAVLARNAYNAFDKAGRTLGVDASELAEKIDLAALITAARDLRDAAIRPNFGHHGRGAYELGVLGAILDKFPV